MASTTIPGGGSVTTNDPGVSDKKARAMTGLADRPTVKASPVFDVKDGGGEGRGVGVGGGGWGGANSASDSNPAGPSGTGLW